MRGVAKKKPECLAAPRLDLEKTGTWNGRLSGEALTADQTEADERRTEQHQGGRFRSASGILQPRERGDVLFKKAYAQGRHGPGGAVHFESAERRGRGS